MAEDIDACAEKALKIVKDAQAEVETGISQLTRTAKDLYRNNAELKHAITQHEATNGLLQQQIEQLQHELAKSQRDCDQLSAAKKQVDAEISSLVSVAQTSTSTLGDSIRQNKALRSQNHKAWAKIETLEIYLKDSEYREEKLEEEVALLKAALAAASAVKTGDKEPDSPTKEVVHKPVPLQDHNTPERNPSNQLAAPATLQALQDKINSQSLLIEKQNRKYDRLVAKKESAERKFFASYVEWHDFKVWWTEFRKYPGVGQKVLEFNREAKKRGLPSHLQMPSSVEKRVLKVVEAAEKGGPDTFPSVASGANEMKETDGADEADVRDVNLPETENAIGLVPFDLDRARVVKRELQDAVEFSKSQLDIDPDPPQDRTTTALPIAGLGTASGNPNAITEEDPLDPEKTQETTPSRSQRPFEFDISGLNIPSIEWYSASTRKPPTLNPPQSSPQSVQRKQPSPPPPLKAAVKEEPQEDENLLLLLPRYNPKTNNSNKAVPKTMPVEAKGGTNKKGKGKESLPFVSSLGKRKAPQDSTTDMEMEEDSLSDRSPLKFANEKGKGKEKDKTKGAGSASAQKPTRTNASANSSSKAGSSHATSTPLSIPSHANKRRALETEQGAKSPVPVETTKTKTPANNGKQKAKAAEGKTTINSRYEINPDQNDGLNFAYDQVVRKKADRKKMDAGVCEECREYYEAIGPMPPRAQPPLWRSPKAGEQPLPGSRTCRHHKGNNRAGGGDQDDSGQDDDDADARDAAITAHRQEISRHRYQWKAPEDPPGYWNIGFPDTQELADINRRAEQMHAEKERMVEIEASKPNGKFRRR